MFSPRGLHCRPQRQAVRAGHGDELAVVTAHPRHNRAVARKRISRSMRISTAPRVHSTSRTTVGSSFRNGMQSVMRTLPSTRSNSLSSTRLSARYRRVTRQHWLALAGRRAPAGAIRQNPWPVPPSRWAKQAAHRTRASEPSRLTRHGRRERPCGCRRSGRRPDRESHGLSLPGQGRVICVSAPGEPVRRSSLDTRHRCPRSSTWVAIPPSSHAAGPLGHGSA